MGMSEDVVRNILVDNNKVPKHGSGVGVINVHSRIKLMFGSEYGLKVYSEPDEGTKVVLDNGNIKGWLCRTDMKSAIKVWKK